MRILIALPMVFAMSVAAQAASPGADACGNCGVITSIQVTTQESEWAPLGRFPGGSTSTDVAGSETRTAFEFGREGSRGLVVVGASGGATYSRQPSSYQRSLWRVTIAMDGGGNRVVPQRYEPSVREGEHVRIVGTQLELVD